MDNLQNLVGPREGCVQNPHASLMLRETVPEVGISAPLMMRVRVVLPAPFRPRIPKRSPGFTENETLSSTVLSSLRVRYCLTTWLRRIIRALHPE